MKKTQNLNLNLLEDRDHMDEAALNENARLVDEAVHRALAPEGSLGGALEAIESVRAALGTFGHNVRAITSFYTGRGTTGSSGGLQLTFGTTFRPLALLVVAAGNASVVSGFSMSDSPALWTNNGQYCHMEWRLGRIVYYHDSNAAYGLNQSGVKYHLILFGSET